MADDEADFSKLKAMEVGAVSCCLRQWTVIALQQAVESADPGGRKLPPFVVYTLGKSLNCC